MPQQEPDIAIPLNDETGHAMSCFLSTCRIETIPITSQPCLHIRLNSNGSFFADLLIGKVTGEIRRAKYRLSRIVENLLIRRKIGGDECRIYGAFNISIENM